MRAKPFSISIKELFSPGTACAVAAAAGAGAAASLHFWGRFKGSSSAILAAEVGTALASAFLCAWCFRPRGLLGGCFTGKNEGEPASRAPPGTPKGCCTGSCGVSCCEEGIGGTEEETLLSEADLEDLQGNDGDLSGLARGASLTTYVQPNAPRRMAAAQKQSAKEERESDTQEENGVSAGAAPCAASTVEEVSRFHGDLTADEGAFLPGRAKIYFKTFGCSHNVSDSEYMQGLLQAAGYQFANRLEDADVCVVNSCTVKSPSEFALYSVIKAALKVEACRLPSGSENNQKEQCQNSHAAATRSTDPDPYNADSSGVLNSEGSGAAAAKPEGVGRRQQLLRRPKRQIPCVVAGCVPEAFGVGKREGALRASPQEILLAQCSVVGVSRISRIVEVVEEALQGRIVRLTGGKNLPPLSLPKIRRNRLVEIVPISTGCLGSCTYCKTKHARGDLGSYTEEAIESRVRSAVAEGATQIWLTSEDTGAYGLDIGSSLTKLLRRLLSLPLGEEVMFKVGMGNPPFLLGQLAAATELLGHSNIFEFLQLPVQSGSNRVLHRMKRDYTVEQFRTVADACLKAHPRMSIMTDVICGFPDESEEDHQQTLRLLSDYRFPAVNISQFYPRPGTPAAAMKQLPSQIVKRRSREVTQLFESYTCYDWMVGTIQKVWFSSNSDRSNHTVGHTKQYVKILVDRDESLLGRACFVRVTAAAKWHCWGTLCGPSTSSLPAR